MGCGEDKATMPMTPTIFTRSSSFSLRTKNVKRLLQAGPGQTCIYCVVFRIFRTLWYPVQKSSTQHGLSKEYLRPSPPTFFSIFCLSLHLKTNSCNVKSVLCKLQISIFGSNIPGGSLTFLFQPSPWSVVWLLQQPQLHWHAPDWLHLPPVWREHQQHLAVTLAKWEIMSFSHPKHSNTNV